MYRLLIIIFLVATHLSCKNSVQLSARKYTFTAPDGFPVTAYELMKKGQKMPASKPRAIVFYVQGSVYETVLTKVDKLASAVIFGARAVLVEKRGCFADSIVKTIAYKYSDKQTWTNDYAMVMDSILRDVRSDVPVILIGASEGGDIAAILASIRPQVTHLILIGSGGGMSQKQELRYYAIHKPGYLGQGTLHDLDEMFEEIETSNDSLEMWSGYPYKRWRTYMNDSAISALLHVDIPILMLHGTADESVPVVSAQRLDSAMKSMGKTNFTYLEYPDVDHSFIHTPTNQSWFPYLERDLIIWLNRHGVVKNLEAKFFLNRVRKNHKELQW